MSRRDFRFFHRLRVRWSEVDMQKVVFNAHYLMYFDTAIADYWRALALPYEESMQRLDGDLYVRKATVEYAASARVDDVLDIGMRCARIGTSSMIFHGGLFRGDELLVTSEIVYVFANPATQTSLPVPAVLRAICEDYEASLPLSEVVLGDWVTLGDEARVLRQAVFIEEQGVPEALEWDDADASAVHAVVRNRLGQVIGTGRLLQQATGVARIGRIAVHRALRGQGSDGHGQAVMQALEGAARERGDTEVLLHAQVRAQGFYARQGYQAQGEVFEEDGIAHVQMRRAL